MAVTGVASIVQPLPTVWNSHAMASGGRKDPYLPQIRMTLGPKGTILFASHEPTRGDRSTQPVQPPPSSQSNP